MKILAILIILASLVPHLTWARASGDACIALFKQSLSPQQSLSVPLNLDALNEASQEYVKRLIYLIRERRLLEPELLDKVALSTRPLNPLGDRPSELALGPHHSAFVDLLKDDLEWEKIRQTVQVLSGSITAEEKRAETVIEKTAEVLTLKDVMSYPFAARKVIQIAKQKTLAVNVERVDNSLTISAFELPSGQQVSLQTIENFDARVIRFDVKAIGNSAWVAIGGENTERLFVIDLLADKVIFDQKIESNPIANLWSPFFGMLGPSTSAWVRNARFIESESKPAVVTFKGKDAFIVNLQTGTYKKAKIDSDDIFEATNTGSFGNRVYVTSGSDFTSVIDPSSPTPTKSFPGLQFIGTFSDQGIPYAIAEDKTTEQRPRHKLLRKINLKTWAVSEPLEIKGRSFEDERVYQVFEEDMTPYAVISTDHHLNTINLRKWQLVASSSETLPADFENNSVHPEEMNQLGFTYQGKSYVVGVLRENSNFNRAYLAIFDPLTLVPLGGMYQIDRNPSGILSLNVIAGEGKNLQLLLSFRDGTSKLISLLSRL